MWIVEYDVDCLGVVGYEVVGVEVGVVVELLDGCFDFGFDVF